MYARQFIKVNSNLPQFCELTFILPALPMEKLTLRNFKTLLKVTSSKWIASLDSFAAKPTFFPLHSFPCTFSFSSARIF